MTFTYNPAGQIVGRSDSNDAFAFTALANQGVTDSHNGLNQVTATGSTSVSHDARGNTSAIGANAYGYDSENHLTSGPGGTTLSYDPLGRLYQVTGGGRDARFLYDGDQVMSVYGPSGNVTEFPVHGEEPNSPLLTYDNTGRAWSHPDERGSVVARSNDAGTVTAVNRYDEYGAPQGGSVAGLFGYTGQAWLPELGMYDYHARVYNPNADKGGGRFMQADPLHWNVGPNGYGYVSGDPVNLIDPMGLVSVEMDGVLCSGYDINTATKEKDGSVTCSGYNFPGGGSGLAALLFGGTNGALGTGLILGSGGGGLSEEGPFPRYLPNPGAATTHDYRVPRTSICRPGFTRNGCSMRRCLTPMCHVPGNYSREPLVNGQSYDVYWGGVRGGSVTTTFSPAGYWVANTTTQDHWLVGVVDRQLWVSPWGEWFVTTRGTGNASVWGMDTVNEFVGPAIFRDTNDICRGYMEGN